MVKLHTVQVLVFGLLLVPPTLGPSVAVLPFAERVQKADLIVEGLVETQREILYDRDDSRAYTKKSTLKVEKVIQGKVPAGETISLYTDMNFICDTSRKLGQGRRYLLMLKRHRDGYADITHGRGMWEIVELEPGKEYMVGDIWLPTWGLEHEAFLARVAWHQKKSTAWPKTPTVTKERAREIAARALVAASIDLTEFDLNKQELIKIGHDIVGVARKDDAMWLIDWEKLAAREVSPRPPGSFAYCYVHAHTGAYEASTRGKWVEPKRQVRLFLKTQPRFREIYHDKIASLRVRQITEEELRKAAGRLDIQFLELRPSYREGSTYWKVVPGRGDEVPSAVAILEPDRRLVYVATVKEMGAEGGVRE